MTPFQRAHTYAVIFAEAGPRWERFIPNDAIRWGRKELLLGPVVLMEVPDGWLVDTTSGSFLARRPGVTA